MTYWSKGAAWMRGEVIPIEEAKIGVTDWGLTHSDITYDVVSVWDGAFFRLEEYLTRFEASMATLRLDVGMTRDEMRAALSEMTARSGLRHAYCAMVASRGAPLIPGTRDPRQCGNHFYAWVVPYIYVIPKEVADKGATLWIGKDVQRIPDNSVNPRAKNYHWGDFTQALFQAKDEGFDTAAVLDSADNVTEGPGFNIFAVKDGKLITSDHGVLEGITRRTVMEIASELGISVDVRPLPLREFMEADEVFLATTGGGLTPIRRVDDRIFSNDAPGPVTLSLREAFYAFRKRPEHLTAIPFPETT